jgi:hypothetical protein
VPRVSVAAHRECARVALEVFGREEELRIIREFVAEASGRPAALLVSGEPGIGKTVLWEAGVHEAERRAVRVLACRGIEAEASLSFSGLSDLLVRVVEETAVQSPSPRRRALEVALLLREPGEAPPDRHAVGLALLDVLQVLARQGPILVAVDDLQWVHAGSLAALQLALRRLRDEPVGFLATVRVSGDAAVPLELERMFREEDRRSLQVAPLSLGALYSLLRERLSLELSRGELGRVREASGANPFFALELGRELIRQGVRPEPGKPLPVSADLARLLGARLRRLSPKAREALLLAAAAASPTLELVAAALGEHERAAAAVEEAADEGIVLIDGERIRFTHPLFASSCYGRASVEERRAAHRVLAAVAGDAEERARHLALAVDGADEAVAAELDAAAAQAAARGATAAAAELSELAAERSEPGSVAARARRFRAGHLHRLAGNLDLAETILGSLLAEVPPGVERADVLFELASTRTGATRSMIELYEGALAEAGSDVARMARVLAFPSAAHGLEGDIFTALAHGRRSLVCADRADDPFLVAWATAQVATAEMFNGARTAGLLERGLEIEERLDEPFEFYQSRSLAG